MIDLNKYLSLIHLIWDQLIQFSNKKLKSLCINKIKIAWINNNMNNYFNNTKMYKNLRIMMSFLTLTPLFLTLNLSLNTENKKNRSNNPIKNLSIVGFINKSLFSTVMYFIFYVWILFAYLFDKIFDRKIFFIRSKTFL